MNMSLARPLGDAAGRLADEAGHIARRGVESLRHGSYQLREKAHHASTQAVWTIKDEPVKAVLVAAAAGAALMFLASFLARSTLERRREKAQP